MTAVLTHEREAEVIGLAKSIATSVEAKVTPVHADLPFGQVRVKVELPSVNWVDGTAGAQVDYVNVDITQSDADIAYLIGEKLSAMNQHEFWENFKVGGERLFPPSHTDLGERHWTNNNCASSDIAL